VRAVYNIRLENLSDEEAKNIIAEIKSLSWHTWWPIYSSRIRDLIYGRNHLPPSGEDEEFYMALMPENQPDDASCDITAVQANNTVDFKLWVELNNQIFGGGYKYFHPINHYHWCEKGRLIPYIAYCNGNPVAVAAIFDNNGIASLECVGTMEEYRRMGFAKATSRTAIRNAFANGAKIITLRAFYPANLLYESLGFKTY